MTQKTNQNPWTMDVRVRERNLKSGALTDKDVEKHLAALPDLADQAEPFGIAQPALTDQPQHVPAPVVHAAPMHAPVSMSETSDDDLGDEDDDDDDAQDDVVAADATNGTSDGGAAVGGDEDFSGGSADGDASDGGGDDVGSNSDVTGGEGEGT